MTKTTKLISWIAASISALIMLQTLYFKFSAAPESVYIFTTLGLEPYGRIGIGVLELIASILLLIPITRIFGAGLGLGLMAGAVFSHLTQLGISVMNDGGYLFILAILVLSTSATCLFLEKNKIVSLLKPLLSFKKH